MEKKILMSGKMPVAGPYSAAVEAGGFIFISGQLPVSPQTGEVIMDIRAATQQILTNLQTLLEENDLSLKHVIKTTLFLKHISDFAAVNEIYAGFFPAEPPARSTVEVSALPKGAPLEIEAVAIRK
jgi:2-iminobutanoate/2-iminopropanoate deaminase